MLWPALVPLLIIAVLGLLLVLWLRFLWKRTRAPKWLLFSLPIVMGMLSMTLGVLNSFGAVAGESVDPSQKARILAEGISEAMNCTAFALIVLMPLVLLALTWKYRWSKTDEETPSE
jgi:cytochrome bd-type quinol oxidase subunit 2